MGIKREGEWERERERTMLTEVGGYPWVVGFQIVCV